MLVRRSSILEKTNKEGFKMPGECFVEPHTFIIQEKYFKDVIELQSCFKFLRAGPRKNVVFKA